MKLPVSLESVALQFEDWVWNRTTGELNGLGQEVVAWLQGQRIDLRRLLASQTDETLALAVQKGFFFGAAFTELFCNRYELSLRRWFRRWGTEQNTVFDLTQEVFVKFARVKLKDYEPPRSFWRYLRQSAYYLWVSQGRQRRPLLADDLDPELADDVLDEVQWREDKTRLGKAVEQLPDDQRAALVSFLEGDEADESARRLGITKERFYGRLFRARRQVMNLLGAVPPSDRGRKRKQNPDSPEQDDPRVLP